MSEEDTTNNAGDNQQQEPTKPRKPRGLAAMSPEKRREIQRKGGLKVNELGLNRKWTSEDAKEMGRRGGLKSKRGPARKDKQQ